MGVSQTTQDVLKAVQESKEAVVNQVKEVLEAYRGEKADLIPILQGVQEKLGYLPEEGLKQIARYINIPESTVFGVATFYAQFKLVPTGRNIIRMQKRAAQQTGSRAARYWRRVREAANQAMFQAIDKGWTPIWGHTHHRHIDAYERWLALNCGDFDQDEIGGLVIDDGVAREWEPPW